MRDKSSSKPPVGGDTGPPGPPTAMDTLLLELPPEKIAAFKAVIESYDNLATLRTEDPRRHHLRLYFAPESAEDVNVLIDSLAAQFSIRRLMPPGGC